MIQCQKLKIFFPMPLIQVRASATPLPVEMGERVMTMETPSCAAAPPAGVAAPAIQVRC